MRICRCWALVHVHAAVCWCLVDVWLGKVQALPGQSFTRGLHCCRNLQFVQRHKHIAIPAIAFALMLVALAGAMASWPGLAKWRSLRWWVEQHGWRSVPLEVGLPGHAGWHEASMTLADFVTQYLAPSAQRDSEAEAHDECRHTLDGRGSRGSGGAAATESDVAYLAQHRLFEQIPELQADVAEPELSPGAGAFQTRNVWMGTRGTVRGHFDNVYDALMSWGGEGGGGG
jgi:hypothetical protein